MDYIHIQTGTRVSSEKELSPALFAKLVEQQKKQPRPKKEPSK